MYVCVTLEWAHLAGAANLATPVSTKYIVSDYQPVEGWYCRSFALSSRTPSLLERQDEPLTLEMHSGEYVQVKVKVNEPTL